MMAIMYLAELHAPTIWDQYDGNTKTQSGNLKCTSENLISIIVVSKIAMCTVKYGTLLASRTVNHFGQAERLQNPFRGGCLVRIFLVS